MKVQIARKPQPVALTYHAGALERQLSRAPLPSDRLEGGI